MSMTLKLNRLLRSSYEDFSLKKMRPESPPPMGTLGCSLLYYVREACSRRQFFSE